MTPASDKQPRAKPAVFEPAFLYPSKTPPRRSVWAKIRGAIQIRVPAWFGVSSEFVRVAKEVRSVTGKPAAADVLRTWRELGIVPRHFAELGLWKVPFEERSEFVTVRDCAPFCRATVDAQDLDLFRDKATIAEHDGRGGLPWAETLAVVNRLEGVEIDAVPIIHDRAEFLPALRKMAVDGDLVLKPACGKQGRGVFHFELRGVARAGDGSELRLEDFVELVFAYRHPIGAYGYVVQRALAPDPRIIELTGVESLSTLRVVTAIRDGEIHTLQSFLKISAPGRLIDNFHGGASGTLVTALDPDSGRLTDLVGRLHHGNRYVLETTAVHPLTGRTIGGRELPGWREALGVAHRAAAFHPRTATIGWDVALTPAGPLLLDVNTMWSPVGPQACHEKGLRPTLAKIFPEYWG